MEDGDLGTDFLDTWTRAITASRKSLERDDRESVEQFTSWDDLQRVVGGSSMLSILPNTHALDPLKAFSEFFETRLGTNLDTAFFWGTLTHLLQLVNEERNNQGGFLPMIKSLASTAERFILCCKDAPELNNPIKIKCVDMQVLFVEFFATSIKYIHAEGEDLQSGVDQFQLIKDSFEKTHKDLENLLQLVKAQVRSQAMGIQSVLITDTDNTVRKLLMLPPTKTDQHYDRDNVFKDLDNILAVQDRVPSFLSVALFGLSGVGKSTAVSTYVEARFRENFYDVILWARGENSVSLRQSFTEIALRLRLSGAQHHSHDQNLILVQDWFQSTRCTWLIVYDNVESADALMPYWPGSNQGRAIITTNDRSIAFKSTLYTLHVSSWDEEEGKEYLLFVLKFKNHIGKNEKIETNSAKILAKQLGGHALAIKQIATLIHRGQFSIEEFSTMYLKDAGRVHRTNELSIVMQWSFEKLDKNSLSLLGMMSFLNSDRIPQKLFEIAINRESSDDLACCTNDFFLEALGGLTTYTLVKKDMDTRVLSVHKIVQTQFKSFSSAAQRQKAFNNVVALLYNALPKEDTSKSQLYENWETYNLYVPHVLNLSNCFMEEMKNSKSFKAPWEFCELCVQFERFLYETSELAELEGLCTVNMAAVATLEDTPRKHNLNATIMSHQANLAESQGNPGKAIDLNKEVYRIRTDELPLEPNLLFQVANNIGYCYNSFNDHFSALIWFLTSYNWWEKSNETKNDFLLGNMARCMLYLDEFEAAREMLDIAIPQLKNSTPSNWAMLSYAYFVLGSLERRQNGFQSAEEYFIQAQKSWLKGDSKRFHPFNGACMYKIGVCCLDQGKVTYAIKHIENSMKVTGFHKISMPIEHARNLFKLSEALLQDDAADSKDKAEAYRMEAETIVKKRQPDIITCDAEHDYDNLIPIFWR